jgi:hypothetical protein
MLTCRAAFVALGGWLIPLIALANEDPLPPLTGDTLVGVWEAVPKDARLVYHMEINKDGESYLAMILAPNAFYRAIFRLVSSEIKEGRVNLHFHTISEKGVLTDVWIEGKAVGDITTGVIDGTVDDNKPLSKSPSGKKQDIFLMKGAWTRMLSQLSQKGEESIKNKSPYP